MSKTSYDPDACLGCSHGHHEDFCDTKTNNTQTACTCEVLCGNQVCHKDSVCKRQKGSYYCECSVCTCKLCQPKVTCGCSKCECSSCVSSYNCGKCAKCNLS